ncbi:hypothetical protein [Halobellus litoreus]|uniref:Cox cluster protein n=1 Tax=Halobellus litoreus TaxID=755310 RepID=A0ABD6DQZ1_9EURY|nr:hypothetical protein [Halobellus litoreus]
MSEEPAATSEGLSGRRSVGVVSGVFSVIVVLAAVSYAAMVSVVNWVTVGVLAYPVGGVAPFVVITGAILTIPVVVPTVLVSVRMAT